MAANTEAEARLSQMGQAGVRIPARKDRTSLAQSKDAQAPSKAQAIGSRFRLDDIEEKRSRHSDQNCKHTELNMRLLKAP